MSARKGQRGARRAPAIHAVIIAGGAGTRFWPLSRRARPKPLIRALGGRSLLDGTLRRARRFAGADRVWLVCGAEHAEAMGKEAGLPRGRVLVEPRMRNTAAAVALAAHRIAAEDPDAVLAVLPADHVIPDAAAFARAIRNGARAAADQGRLVTLGVRPTRAETGYGYIRLGKPLAAPHAGLHDVSRFVEKPDRPKARRYWKSGRYLWNAGVFVWRAQDLLDELAAHAPRVARAMQPLADAGRRDFQRSMAQVYGRVPAVPIDKAVLEKSDRVACLPVDFHWSDVGTWHSLAQELGVDADVNRVMAGELLASGASGNLVHGGDRPVVLVGVSGIAVIDTGDAVLVADLAHAADVREVVEGLRRKGRRELL